MRAVGQKDTRPEIEVRRLLRRLGAHYRVRNRDLPGSPDIANRARGWAIQVQGCFWHGHRNCLKTKSGRTERVPASNQSYWGPKIADNRARDARTLRELRNLGFRVLLVWECELRDPENVEEKLSRFLVNRV